MASLAQTSCEDAQDDDMLRQLEILMISELSVDGQKEAWESDGFRYPPLPDKSSIRLLALEPGIGNSTVCGALKNVPLENTGSYEAVSYVWGSPHKWFTMRLNGDTVPITESAHKVLRRFRHATSVRTLWIDMLCINQADHREKSAQVSLMGKIYGSASQVLCWLGEDDRNDGATAFQLLEEIGRLNWNTFDIEGKNREFLRANDLPDLGDSRWLSLVRVFRRPWFRRMWIIQEFVLGRDARIICGRSETLWKTISLGVVTVASKALLRCGSKTAEANAEIKLAMKGLATYAMMTTTKWYRNEEDTPIEWLTPLVQGFGLPARDWRGRFEEFNPGVGRSINPNLIDKFLTQVTQGEHEEFDEETKQLATRVAEEPHGERTRPSLYDAISEFHYSAATDPRDVFYALLGISAEHDEVELQPDYSESIELTHIRFHRHFLLHPVRRPRDNGTQARHILVYAGSAFRKTSQDLPSWVPESRPPEPDVEAPSWTSLLTLPHPATTHLYDAADGTVRKCRDTDDPRTLYVSGGHVDVVSRVISQPTYPPKSLDREAFEVYEEFLAEMEALLRARFRPYAALGETDDSVLWQTLIARSDLECLEVDDSFRESYHETRRRLKHDHLRALGVATMTGFYPRMTDWLPEWGRKWLGLAEWYSVCETEGGLFGLVPNGTRVGDEICIFLGEVAPFVVRPVKDDPAKHELLGACYMHGIMDGEALELGSWKEIEYCLQ